MRIGRRAYAEMLGVNPKLVRTDEDAQASLEREQQAIAAQAQAEQVQRAAAGAKSLADADMGADSALTRLVSAAQQANAA